MPCLYNASMRVMVPCRSTKVDQLDLARAQSPIISHFTSEHAHNALTHARKLPKDYENPTA